MTALTHPDRAPLFSDADSLPFWEACRSGTLVGQQCGACGKWRWPPRDHCPHCHAAAPTWPPTARTGTVRGAVLLHRAFDPGFADELPTAIVHVEMDGTDGQMLLIGNLLPPLPAAEAVGRRVTADFRAINGDAIPFFTLSGDTNDR
jgi:uncharacterized OB-fold protein